MEKKTLSTERPEIEKEIMKIKFDKKLQKYLKEKSIDEIIQITDKLKFTEKYLEKAIQYTKGKDYGFNQLPTEFNSVIEIDIYIENLQKSLQRLYEREKNNVKNIISFIGYYMDETKHRIKNPLLKDNKDIYKYLHLRLKTIKNQWNDYLIPQNISGINGFKSDLTDKQIEELFNNLKGNYITNTKLDFFKAIFKDEPLPDGFEPVEWKNSIPLFLCLMFGFDNKKIKGEKISDFKGIVKKQDNYYTTATKCFKFPNPKVINKTLSSENAKLFNKDSVHGLNKLLQILPK